MPSTYAWPGDERDGTRLGRHDRQRHSVPGHGPSREDVMLDVQTAAAAPEAVEDDSRKGGGEDDPVNQAHRSRGGIEGAPGRSEHYLREKVHFFESSRHFRVTGKS